MPIFVDPNRTLDYVLEEQRESPPAERVTFKLRALTAREFADFREVTSENTAEGRRTLVFSFDIELLRLALTGWSGKGAPPFPDPATPEAVEGALSCLSPEVRDELVGAAWKLTRMEEEGKDG